MNVSKLIKGKYRSEIDGIRAFAVLAVIINHFNKELLPSGYLGVDIFFVISGYVITSSLAWRKSRNFHEFLIGFYERRIKRLIPALVFFVLSSSFLILLFNPDPHYSLMTGISSLFGLSNIYLLKQSTNYFAASTELNIFTHTWSLGIEEQFYIFFPFLVWFTGFGKQKKYGASNLLFILIILSFISLISFVYTYPINQSSAYFLITNRFWEMAAGCILYLLNQKKNSIIQFLKKISSSFVLLLIIIILFFPTSYAVSSTILIVFLSSILIISMKEDQIIYNFFSNKKVVYVGIISYSLYLWHWTILSISRWTIGIHWWTIPFQIILIASLAIFSYKFIETPLRYNNWDIKKWKTILRGFLVLITSGATLFIIDQQLKGIFFIGKYKYNHLITYGRNKELSSFYTSKQCHKKSNENFNYRFLEECSINNNSDIKIFFLGNSHTDHYREMHVKVANTLGLSIDGITVVTCTFPNNPNQKDCGNIQTKQEIRVLNTIKKGDLVVIANRYPIFQGGNNNWLHDKESIKRLEEFAKLVSLNGGKVLLFGPSPEFDVPISICNKDWFRPYLNKNCSYPKKSFIKNQFKIYNSIKNLSENIIFYNPLNSICFEDKCSLIDPLNRPLYIDDDHFTDFANTEYISKDFLKFLRNNNLLY